MTRKKLPAILEPEEAQNLLKQPNKRYPTGLRNKAMMALMLHCGLRISEVVNLRPGNINLTKGKLRIENGKGNKDRDLAIPEYLIDLLDSWRKKRPPSDYFFTTLKGKQKNFTAYIKTYICYAILQANKRYRNLKKNPGPFRYQHHHNLYHPGQH